MIWRKSCLSQIWNGELTLQMFCLSLYRLPYCNIETISKQMYKYYSIDNGAYQWLTISCWLLDAPLKDLVWKIRMVFLHFMFKISTCLLQFFFDQAAVSYRLPLVKFSHHCIYPIEQGADPQTLDIYSWWLSVVHSTLKNDVSFFVSFHVMTKCVVWDTNKVIKCWQGNLLSIWINFITSYSPPTVNCFGNHLLVLHLRAVGLW